MGNNAKDQNENATQKETVRWVTAPVSLDKLRITAGHERAANELTPIVRQAVETHEKVIFAAGVNRARGKARSPGLWERP